jgi:hypothetical protein
MKRGRDAPRCHHVDVVQAMTDSDADAAKDTYAPERMWREATARTRAIPGCDSVQRQNSERNSMHGI